MLNFEFYNPARIVFGKGTEESVGERTANFGKNILLHYGGGSIKKNGTYDKVLKSLKEQNLNVIELDGVKPNPRLSLVRKGIEICKKENIDFILAVGGGSVIDSAKAIAIGAKYDKDVWDFFISNNMAKEAIPIGVVLTIPAAGSESSSSCVITNDEDNNYKRGTQSLAYIPKFAILNPEFCYSLPRYQIACGCSDILAHLIERYFTEVENVELSDRLIEGAVKTILNNAPIAYKDKTNYDAWAEIMWTGTIAHNNLLNMGRIGDWASHQIEHELSALYDLTHGAGLAIVIPAWMKYVYKHNIDKFYQFATRVFHIIDEDKEKAVLKMIERLEKWYCDLDLPIKLSQVNIEPIKFEEMAERALLHRGTIGNFKKLVKEDIVEIYNLCM